MPKVAEGKKCKQRLCAEGANAVIVGGKYGLLEGQPHL